MIANIGQEKLSNAQLIGIRQQADPIVYLAIDPGKTNGVCGYTEDYSLQFMITVHADQLDVFLDQFDNVKTLVLEDYKVYPGKQNDHVYSDLLTPQIIGAVKSWARRKHVNLVLQMAHIKTTGYAWIGQKPLPKSNPQNHALDAHVHFMYWGVKTGKINARDLIRK